MKAKKSLQPKVERSKIPNTVPHAAPYSVYNTTYATYVMFLNTSSSFRKEITYVTTQIRSFTTCNKSITALAVHNTSTHQVHSHLPLLPIEIIIFSFKVLFSSVVKFITSSWNCKYAPNLLILRYNFHSCHPLAPQSHQNALLSSTLLLIFFNINTS